MTFQSQVHYLCIWKETHFWKLNAGKKGIYYTQALPACIIIIADLGNAGFHAMP